MSLGELRQIIAAQPRLELGDFPTPLVELPRLSEELGVELWLKRDEMSGIALGGNKTRKMEFILADALRQGYTDVITTGALTSNHTMMTAVAARRAGLQPHCFISAAPPEVYEGNMLLLDYIGANLIFAPFSRQNAEEYQAFKQALADQAAELSAYLIPAGGTMPVGEFGYMNAVLEIATQSGGDLPFDAIFLAFGTGGTSTGLALGQAVAGFRVPIYGVAVGSRKASLALKRRTLPDLVDHMLAELGLDDYPPPPVHPVFGYAESGYAVPTAGADAANRLLARTEGYFLDPVYTAKAFDGMLGLIADGTVPRGSRVLFVHTGGLSMLPVASQCWG
jgi:L-cysteate sulfo-lyase